MSGSRVLLLLVLSTLVADCSSYTIEMPLHRMARTPHLNTALLVPFPRVGKRDSSSTMQEIADQPEYPHQMAKRLYFARVGKRYMYAARVGK